MNSQNLVSIAFSYFLAKGRPNKTVYHYTTVEALFSGIVSNKREPGSEICLWASNCEYMNDPDEIKTGIEFSEQFLTHLTGEETKISESSIENLKNGAFILSLSRCPDELPMWNTYGNNAKGINLELDLTDYVAHKKGQYLAEMLYSYPDGASFLADKIKKLAEQDNVKELMDEMNNNVSIESLFIILSMIAKNEYYDYEQECRLTCIDPKEIDYRCSKGLIIPYTKVCLPKEKLKSITIGPCADYKLTEKSLRTYLNAIGFEHVLIKQSSINYRS